MKRLLPILLLIFSCCNEPEILQYSDFIVETDAIKIPKAALSGQMLSDTAIVYFHPDKSKHLKYYFGSGQCDTVLKDMRYISKFYYITDDSLLVVDDYGCFFLQTIKNKVVDNKYPLQFTDTNYNYFPTLKHKDLMINGLVCTRMYVKKVDYNYKNYDYNNYLNVPFYSLWYIDSNKMVQHTTFGARPSDHPLDNYFDNSRLFFTFNDIDSLLVCATALSDLVKIYDLQGREIAEHYMGSKSKMTLLPFNNEQESNSSEYIKYSQNNTIYSSIHYDRYRNMYYRIMSIPPNTDRDAMVKPAKSWVLIVADSDFNIKYEVTFENTNYIPGLFITSKGVYITNKSNKTNKDYEMLDLFIFD